MQHAVATAHLQAALVFSSICLLVRPQLRQLLLQGEAASCHKQKPCQSQEQAMPQL